MPVPLLGAFRPEIQTEGSLTGSIATMFQPANGEIWLDKRLYTVYIQNGLLILDLLDNPFRIFYIDNRPGIAITTINEL